MRTQSPDHSSARGTIAVGLILLLGAVGLAGCSGDDGDKDPGKSQTKGAGKDDKSGKTTELRDCKVQVTLSGAVTDSLGGKGRAVYHNSSGPKAFYQFASGDTSVQVYSEGENFTPSAVVSTKDGTFTTEPGAKGLDVSTDGKSAKVDADTVGLDEKGEGVHVKATYACK